MCSFSIQGLAGRVAVLLQMYLGERPLSSFSDPYLRVNLLGTLLGPQADDNMQATQMLDWTSRRMTL